MKQDFRAIETKREAYLAEKADELRAALRGRDPNLVAVRSGCFYLAFDSARGEFRFPFWGVERVLSFPELIAESLSTFQHSLLFYYLLTSDGTPASSKWVSFADLPDGRMYNAAFQGYSGDEISKAFGFDLESFSQACVAAGGTRSDGGDAAYVFQALPRVPVLVNYWLGDEDFPSTCKILFDDSASHYLPIDACAMVGSALAHRLVSLRK